jgi:hypothetical protein
MYQLQEKSKYVMRLMIQEITELDEGDYFCHAENAFGSVVQPVAVRIHNTASSHNVTQCCIEQNVTAGCMEACNFYLDIDSVIEKSECIADFDKLMKCAADGSGNPMHSTSNVSIPFHSSRPQELLRRVGCSKTLSGLVQGRTVAERASLRVISHETNSRMLPRGQRQVTWTAPERQGHLAGRTIR